MEPIKVNNIIVSQLAKQYNVDRVYIFNLRHRGYNDDQIIQKLNHMNSESYKIQRLFIKYVNLYLKKILFYFENPEQRKKVKEEYFTEWNNMGLPITINKLEDGWQKIVKEAYYDAI